MYRTQCCYLFAVVRTKEKRRVVDNVSILPQPILGRHKQTLTIERSNDKVTKRQVHTRTSVAIRQSHCHELL